MVDGLIRTEPVAGRRDAGHRRLADARAGRRPLPRRAGDATARCPTTWPNSTRWPTGPPGRCCCATPAARPTPAGWTSATDLPKIIRAGRHIARPKRYLRNYGDEVEPADLVAEVERQAARGDGWVKLVGDWIDREIGDLAPLWPADVAAAAIDRAHELGCRVTAHVFGEQAVAELVAAGIDGIEHGTGIDDATIALMAERQVALVPTMVQLDNFEAYARAGEAKFPAYAKHIRALYASRLERFAAARRGRRADLRRDRRGRLPAARAGRSGDGRARAVQLRRTTPWAPAPGGPGAGSADPATLDDGRARRPGRASTPTREPIWRAARAPRMVILRGGVVAVSGSAAGPHARGPAGRSGARRCCVRGRCPHRAGPTTSRSSRPTLQIAGHPGAGRRAGHGSTSRS